MALGDVRVLGLVYGQDINVWRELVVLKDSSKQVVNGEWDVLGNITFLGSVYGPNTALLDGVEVQSFINTLTLRKEHALQSKDDIIR